MSFRFIKRRWFQILIGGLLLFAITEFALRVTGNPNFIPTALLLGAFAIPVAFVVYFYERERSIDRKFHGETPLVASASCFFVGGIVGVVAAGLVEYETLTRLGPLSLFGVGLIEEAAKLMFPVILFFRSRYKSEADGLLFGVASGMGFAALETMGYGLVTLIKSQGNIGLLEDILLVRGVLSPAGHAAWTGLVCAVMWRERIKKAHFVLNFAVIGTFIVAVALHAMWDIVNSLGGPTVTQLIIVIAGNLAIATISLVLLFKRLRESTRYNGTSLA